MSEQKREPVEPILDQWASCPTCGYESLFELAIELPHEDNWLPKFCPNCGQEFLYDDSWKDENGRIFTPEQIPVKHTRQPRFSKEEKDALEKLLQYAQAAIDCHGERGYHTQDMDVIKAMMEEEK